ncbi:MAG TPA: patatin-like phospholipase family protein [Actinomycetota bacterium]
MGRVVSGIRGRVRGSRARKKDKVAFVLSGGGVLGAMQVGQLEALIGAGIVPDLIVGASVGALNGAAIAARPDMDGVDCLKRTWLGLKSEDIFPGSSVSRALSVVLRGDHLYPNSGIRALIDKVAAQNFEQMPVPLSVCAANMRTGEETWFEHGPIAPAILASTALPGLFPTVEIDGERFTDGGIVNNVPISRAVELGATKIYVLYCASNGSELPTRGAFGVLLRAFAHSRAARATLDLKRYAGQADIEVLPTFDPGTIHYKDTSHGTRLYAEALALTSAHLASQAEATA